MRILISNLFQNAARAFCGLAFILTALPSCATGSDPGVSEMDLRAPTERGKVPEKPALTEIDFGTFEGRLDLPGSPPVVWAWRESHPQHLYDSIEIWVIFKGQSGCVGYPRPSVPGLHPELRLERTGDRLGRNPTDPNDVAYFTAQSLARLVGTPTTPGPCPGATLGDLDVRRVDIVATKNYSSTFHVLLDTGWYAVYDNAVHEGQPVAFARVPLDSNQAETWYLRKPENGGFGYHYAGALVNNASWKTELVFVRTVRAPEEVDTIENFEAWIKDPENSYNVTDLSGSDSQCHKIHHKTSVPP